MNRFGVTAAAALGVALLAADLRADEAAVEVEIRGDLVPRGADGTAASTALEGDALDRPGASTAEVLSGSPGVQVARNGGSAELATVTLRGATSAETPVYLGPILLNDELTGTADLSTVPPFFLRRIEVYRGHAPIDLERSGLAGAVVLEPFVASGTRARAAFGVGSFYERFASVSASAGTGAASAAVALRLDATRGSFAYTDDRGTRFDESDDVEVERRNADARSADLWSSGRLALGERGTLDLLVRVFTREQGVPGLGVIPALEARATTRQALGAARTRVACTADPKDRCHVELTGWGRVTSYRLDDPRGELLFTRQQQITLAESFGTRIAFDVSPADVVSLQAGGSFSFAKINVDALGAPDVHASRSSTRAFASVTFSPAPSSDLRLEGAVASDSLEGGAGDGAAIAPQARAGAAFRPAERVELFVTAGRYARVPTLGEQFGVTATVLGNASLRPEAGWSGDIGARAAFEPGKAIELAAEAVFFARYAEDLIAYERSSFGALRPFNVGTARFLGVEGVAATRLLGWLEAGTTVSFLDARDVTDGRTLENDQLPFQSPLVASFRAGVHVREIAPRFGLSSVRAGAVMTYRAGRVADPAGLVALPSQTLLDLHAAITVDHDMLEIEARVSNVLDDRTTDLVGYPLPGRAAHFAIGAVWK